MVSRDEFMQVVDSDGRTLIRHVDPDRLEDRLLSLAPGDVWPICARDGIPFRAEVP